MMDWFTADWGDPALDLGHLKHRELAGQQIWVCTPMVIGRGHRTSWRMERWRFAFVRMITGHFC